MEHSLPPWNAFSSSDFSALDATAEAVCKTVSGKPAKRATLTPWDFGHEPETTLCVNATRGGTRVESTSASTCFNIALEANAK